jgi:hypothetical protein
MRVSFEYNFQANIGIRRLGRDDGIAVVIGPMKGERVPFHLLPPDDSSSRLT